MRIFVYRFSVRSDCISLSLPWHLSTSCPVALSLIQRLIRFVGHAHLNWWNTTTININPWFNCSLENQLKFSERTENNNKCHGVTAHPPCLTCIQILQRKILCGKKRQPKNTLKQITKLCTYTEYEFKYTQIVVFFFLRPIVELQNSFEIQII